MIKEEFDEKISEFEEILQALAGNIASGVISEKLAPSDLLKETENHVNSLISLTARSDELMLILKPEKAHTIKSRCTNLTQTLTTFKEILVQNTPDPLANSGLAFEQLKKALADGSSILFLMREIRKNPSPVINAILAYRTATNTRASVLTIQAPEEIQPLIKLIFGHLDEMRTSLGGLERKVAEMKRIVRELQEESTKMLSTKTPEKPKATESKTENKQLSLTNFRAEQNRGSDYHDNG